MTDLAEFLLARIAERKAEARDMGEHWPYDGGWSPEHVARVLAECEAKREVVEDLRDELANQHDPEPTTMQLAERTLITLALPDADHPDFREEWRA